MEDTCGGLRERLEAKKKEIEEFLKVGGTAADLVAVINPEDTRKLRLLGDEVAEAFSAYNRCLQERKGSGA